MEDPPQRRLTTACLINHFEYGEYIVEAVQSALAQTRRLDEIIVVDDGSSPKHLACVREAAALDPRIELIEKGNGGQLSCFQVSIERSRSDLVFFLDADDRWDPNYVERASSIYEQRPEIDFIATKELLLRDDGSLEGGAEPSRELGYSAARCLQHRGAWVGAPTSCLSMRARILSRIFPVPDPGAWRICADEALVYGSSLVGARKLFLGEPLVHYRVHDRNRFYGRGKDIHRDYERRLAATQILEHLRRSVPLPQCLAALAHYEFRTLEAPSMLEYKSYRRLVWRSKLPLRAKCRISWGLWTQYRLGKMM